jgi:hypothetical protein
MPSIQHGPRAVRLLPWKGPELHLSMYRDVVTTDDDSSGGRREPGKGIERSEP